MKKPIDIEGVTAMEQLTDVEQKVFNAWAKKMPGDVKIETHMDMIRQSMVEMAHHEAAHAVANVFFGAFHSHFGELTIIPTNDYLGRFMQRNTFAPSAFCSEPKKWILCLSKIIEHLSGRVVQSRFGDEILPIEEEIYNGWESTMAESEEEWFKCDEGMALKVAEKISKGSWTPIRILNMAERWTEEFFNIPEISNVVEALAQRLLKVGEISDFEEYDSIVQPIFSLHYKFPVWNRRLKPKYKNFEDFCND